MRKAFEVTVLGTSSATPTKYRHPSAHYVRLEGSYMLLDCGEGAQRQLSRYGLRVLKISHVFITHLHGDHYFGLPGLITSMALYGRTEPLVIVGPPALESIIQVLIAESDSVLPYDLQYIQTQTESMETVVETEQFKVISVPLKHRVSCTGFLVQEKGPELKLNVDACVQFKVPVDQYEAIKMGADYQSQSQGVIANSLLTTPRYKNRTYAYITDTLYDPEYLLPILKAVDLLYHEATFLHDRADRAAETFHSTALQAAQIAQAANVKQLMIGHFSARYNDAQPLLDEAQSVFVNTVEAVEGQTYMVGEYSKSVFLDDSLNTF
ncbi:MAG: ribonuclease Z [Bacteroidota bacterium]